MKMTGIPPLTKRFAEREKAELFRAFLLGPMTWGCLGCGERYPDAIFPCPKCAEAREALRGPEGGEG